MKKFSKKLMALLCAAVTVFIICGCTETDAPAKETPKTSSSSSTEDKTETFKVGDTAVFKNLKITANEMKESTGSEYFSAAEGKIFIGVNFTIENISKESQAISSLLLFEAYSDDVKCDYSLSAAMAFSDGSLDGDIAPGKKLTGWYAIEVPKDWKTVELHVASSWLSNSKAVFVISK